MASSYAEHKAMLDALAAWNARLGAELEAAGEDRRRVYAVLFGAACADLPADPVRPPGTCRSYRR